MDEKISQKLNEINTNLEQIKAQYNALLGAKQVLEQLLQEIKQTETE